MKSNGVKTIKKSDMQWYPSVNTPGWSFVMLSGSLDSAYTVLCRCEPNTNYASWICDGLTECYVIKGSIILNGIELEPGEYGSVDAKVDGYLTSKTGMETLSVMHGKVVFAAEEFAVLRKGPISVEKAKELSALPWIDHLRRNATEQDINGILTWIKPSDNEDLIELCIGVARNLVNKEFTKFIKTVLDGNLGLSLRISAVLYLASKGEMDEAQWTAQLGAMSKDPAELLRVARYFYGVKDNKELVGVINEKRKDTGKYKYNERYYELLFRLAS